MRIHESSVRLHETYFSSLESEDVENVSLENIAEEDAVDLRGNEHNASSQNETNCSKSDESTDSNVESQLATNKNLELTAKTEITPKKALSPKQLEKKLLSEQKKRQKQEEREERERKKQEEKEEKLKLKMEKQKQKQELEEQKKKEKEGKEEQKKREREEKEEQKRKEKEEREQKRKEKEQREEEKRKEKEMEKLKKQQEIEEKNREKQKQEEQKQKAAAAFVNFFVPKKADSASEEKKTASCNTTFMPFEVKSDMRLAPVCRRQLTNEEKQNLTDSICKQDCGWSYLDRVKLRSSIRTSGRTWPYEDSSDDVIVVEDADLGQSICEEKSKSEKMRAKLLKFEENRRPAYFGTWRKTSKVVNPRRPFAEDKQFFDYEVDSDDDWEEEEQGESITGSDDEDKENDSDNEYEVDNDFFVPHGHLSEDEMDDEETSKLSPESHKAKLKLLKNEFDEEMKCKTQKIKPRVIGCVWYKKNSKVDETIDRFLQPLAIISRGQIKILKRNDPLFPSYRKKQARKLDPELIPDILQLVHGNTNKLQLLANEFIAFVGSKDSAKMVSKRQTVRQLKELAKWTKCPENGPMFDKYCWYVDAETRKKHSVDLSLPNKWNYITKLLEM